MKSIFTLIFTVLLTATSFTQGTFVNPIYTGQDPWIMKKDGFYYFLESEARGLVLYKSTRITERGVGKVLTLPAPSGWNTTDVWAPEIHYLEGKWYIYYAAGTGSYPCPSCTGVPLYIQYSGVLECATQDPQEGQWLDKGQLYTGDDYTNPSSVEWAIDLTTFVVNGQRYAMWSGWENGVDQSYICCFTQQNLYIAPMDNPYTISANRVRISSPTLPWEIDEVQRINEGPQVLYNGGDSLYILYSAPGFFSEDYALGQLSIHVNDDFLNANNWEKRSAQVFKKTNTVWGVGHCSFVKSPDDTEDWIVYHSKLYQEGGAHRTIRAQKFTWNPDGSPNFGTPVSNNTSLPLPSGELGNNPGISFADTFDAGNYNNWTIQAFDYNVRIDNNALSIGNNHGGVVVGEKALVRNYDWTDFSYEADVTITNGTRDAGLIFRASESAVGWDATKGYFYGASIQDAKVYFGKMDGQGYTHLADIPQAITLNQTYTLKVVATGTSFEFFIDGTSLGSVSDNSYSKGMCGVRTVATKATFDNVVVNSTVANPIGKAATPTGTASLCKGMISTGYSTTGAANANSYVWNISPISAGNIAGTTTTATVTWSTSFSGTANISVYGTDGANNGSVSGARTTTVTNLATPVITGNTTICNGDAFLFNATNIAAGHNKLWSDGTTGNTMTGTAPVGDYTISLKATDPVSSCSAIGYYNPSVVALPHANIAGDTLYCDGETFLFTAESLGSNTVEWHDGSTNTTLTGVAPVNNYTLAITVTDATTSCTNTDIQNAAVEYCLGQLTTGIEENLLLPISLFPNPATTSITITSEDLFGEIITIINTIGEVLYKEVARNNTHKINTSTYEGGIYFVKIGNTTSRLIIIK